VSTTPTTSVTVSQNVTVPIAPRNSGLAVAALVLGLTTICTFGATGIPAVVLGILGLRDTRTRHVPGEGMAITGLIFGALAVLGWLGWWGLLLLGTITGGTA
jgi:Na+/pantothenate symporter